MKSLKELGKSIGQVVEGYRNLVAPPEELKALIEAVSEERRSICLNCPFNSTEGAITNLSYCKSCGCNLKAKTKCLSCNCPTNKWNAVTTQEEKEDIENKIKNS